MIRSSPKKSDERMETLMHSFQTNTMERMEAMMRLSNETMLQQVGVQLRGMNTTIEKMKEDGEDKYGEMSEKISTIERRLTTLEDTSNKSGALKNTTLKNTTKHKGNRTKESGRNRIPR